MSSSFEFHTVDRFTAGTVGPAGQRVFHLQAVADGHVVTLKVEKTQVAALADYLARLLADLPTPERDEVPPTLDLLEPVLDEWTVGQIGVIWDDDRDRFVVRADEVEVADQDGNPLPDVGDGIAVFVLTRAQVEAFVVRAATLVSSGRPTCPLCGRPIDPEGHVCVKTNGHAAH